MTTYNPGYNFNLIDRPWIRAVWGDQTPDQLNRIGIRQALAEAHHLREIHGDTPPETAAIHRLLLAVLYRIFRPWKNWSREWGVLWNTGYFDTSNIDAYLSRQEIYPRFDLFDAERPFFQAGVNHPVWATKYKTSSVIDLCLPFANDDAAVLFNHRSGVFELTAAQAALALVTHQAFALGGLNDPSAPTKEEIAFSNAPCSRGVIFLLQGRNLFETLLLNLFPLDLESGFRLSASKQDRPAWEVDNPFSDDPERPYGYLDYSTWLSRRVLLYPEGDPENPLVRQMRFYVGMKRMNGEPLNPLMNQRVNTTLSKGKTGSEAVHSPVNFRADRALWRDSVSLFAWAEEKTQGQIAPRALTWVGEELQEQGVLSKNEHFFLGAYGICSSTGKQKMFALRAERFPLPAAYLQESGLNTARQLKLALQRADETARILSPFGALGEFAGQLITAGGREPDRNQVRALLASTGAERFFWSRLEGRFVRLVQDLPERPDEAISAWNGSLCALARQAFEQAVQTIGGGRSFAAYGKAANLFDWQLKCVFDPLEVKAEREQKRTARRSRHS